MDNKIAKRCIEYRAAHNLNQTEMAKLCKVHFQTIHNCEKGKGLSKLSTAKILMVIGDKEG